MHLSLPEVFPLQKLEKFEFGKVEAGRDDLLLSPLGFCQIQAVEEVLRDGSTLIVGPRGVGKSALFRLLKEGRLHFKSVSPAEQFMIPVDSAIDYQALRTFLMQKVDALLSDVPLKSRVVWELFLVYRTLLCIEAEFASRMPEPLNETLLSIRKIFDLGENPASIVDMLRSLKLTAGVRLDSQNVLPVPEAYLSAEPATPVSDGSRARHVDSILNLAAIKLEINTFLVESGRTAFILVDELDQFVTHDDYETQKTMLQGLLEVARDYAHLGCLKLKVFVRDDLLARMDFGRIGRDKVYDTVTKLEWSAEDIRRFIAQRLLYNLLPALEMKQLFMLLDKKLVVVDERSAMFLFSGEKKAFKITPLRRSVRVFKDFASRLREFFAKPTTPVEGPDPRDAEHVNLTDSVNREVIHIIFPRKVVLGAERKDGVEVEFVRFVEDYFALSNGKTTPRIILSFLKECLRETKDYYNNNPVSVVRLDENGEYPLVKRKLVDLAYKNLRGMIWANFAVDVAEWRDWFGRLQDRKPRRSMRLNDIRNITQADDVEELARFVAFLSHTGLLRCENPQVSRAERRYRFPPLFAG